MHKASIEIWITFYHFHTREKYLFDGKQMIHLKQLCKKVKAKVIEKGMEPSDENVLNSLKMFLNSVKDKWILDNLDISLINSRFNVLYVNAIKQSPFVNPTADYFKAKYGASGAAKG